MKTKLSDKKNLKRLSEFIGVLKDDEEFEKGVLEARRSTSTRLERFPTMTVLDSLFREGADGAHEDCEKGGKTRECGKL